MRRESHVRFWEGLGVQFPRATRLIIVLSREKDARSVMGVLPKRFGRYGLTLHPEKTRLIEFRRPDRRNGGEGGGTFDLLGFTHFWGMSRKGKWIVIRKTARDRFGRAIRRVTEWCRRNRHSPVRKQWERLKQMLRGHFGYFGIIGNSNALTRFRFGVTRAWRKWLDRRSQRARVTWARMNELLRRYPLPLPHIARPYSGIP